MILAREMGKEPMIKRAPTLLVVDDEPGLAASIGDMASEYGFNAQAVDDPIRFKEVYDSSYDVVVIDLLMPQLDGIELIRFLSDTGCESSIILISGFDTQVLYSAVELAKAQGLDVIGSLTKPLRMRQLEELLDRAKMRLPRKLELQPSGPTAADLKQALDQQELSVAFQPKVDLATNQVVGLEALARWTHPEMGEISPVAFIPIAEEADLIDSVTQFVLFETLRQSQGWLKQGLLREVAVNMSPRMLSNLNIPELIVTSLREQGLSVSHLVLEVTETALMRELVKSLEVLTRLRMKGIRLAIDDFGTGYSTMQQLQRYPFTELKIDRSFVQRIETDDECRAIVDTTIELARRLKMTTVAEGVETESAVRYLTQQGCNLIQGYFIAKPMTPQDFEVWLLRRRSQLQ